MVVIPAIWRRSGRGFDSRHLHPSAFDRSTWVCLGGGVLVSTGRAKVRRQPERRRT